MFKINDRVRLKHDNKENPALTVRSEVGGQRFLCISDCGQRMVWACDHELELVERNADLKQAIREVLLSEQFLMEFAKAFASASVPSTVQSWSPITGSASEAYCLQKMERERQAEQPKVAGHFDDTEGVWVDEKSPFDGRRSSDKILEVAVEVTGEVKNPIGCPDGWRWLERGELIRNGDKPVKGDAIPLLWIGTPCCGEEFILRRNRFEVGEKVVDCRTGLVRTVQGTDRQYSIVFLRGFPNGIESKHLAPCIEDTK